MRVRYGQFIDEGHSLEKGEHQLIEAALTEQFLGEHLGTFSAPDDVVLDIPTFTWIKKTR